VPTTHSVVIFSISSICWICLCSATFFTLSAHLQSHTQRHHSHYHIDDACVDY